MPPKVEVHEPTIPSGEGASLIPEDFGRASSMFGQEWLMRRMMRDPWLGLADALIRALVLEGEHRIVSAIGDLPPNATPAEEAEKATADKVAEFHRTWIKNLKRPLRRTLWHSLDAVAYGHKLCEIETAVVAGGFIAPVDIAPKPRTAYEMVLDKSNRLEKVRASGTTGPSSEVPPTALFIFSHCGRDDDPHGTPALERAYEAWYRKGCAKPNETKALAAFAGGVAWAEADAGTASSMDVVVDGVNRTQIATHVVASEAAKLKVGRVAAFPPGWHLKHFPPANNFGAFDSSYDRCDREMVTALLVAARSVMEARFGSRADSGTAEGMVASVKDWLRGELCSEFGSQVLMVYTVANFGVGAAKFCPSLDIVTEERSELAAVTAAIRDLDAAGILVPELVDHFLSLVGVSEAVRRAVVEFMEDMALTEPEPVVPGEEEEEDDPKAFAKGDSGPPIRRKSIQRADNGARRLVSRYDRSLRKLTARWTKGRITSDVFVDRFSEQLTKGHEAAAVMGASLAGHKADVLPLAVREYVAATLGNETEFLLNLVADVEEGVKSPAQARLAARRYAQRMTGTVAAAFHEASPADAEFWWELGAAEMHCSDCPRLAAGSPYLKDELITRPREGETECSLGCMCRIIRGDGAAGPGPVVLGGY